MQVLNLQKECVMGTLNLFGHLSDFFVEHEDINQSQTCQTHFLTDIEVRTC